MKPIGGAAVNEETEHMRKKCGKFADEFVCTFLNKLKMLIYQIETEKGMEKVVNGIKKNRKCLVLMTD